MALTSPPKTEGAPDNAPVICAWCPPEYNQHVMTWFEKMFGPSKVVEGQWYCSNCFIALEAAGNCNDELYGIDAVKYALEKLDQAKQEGLSKYDLDCLLIKWRFENGMKRKRQRRRKNN